MDSSLALDASVGRVAVRHRGAGLWAGALASASPSPGVRPPGLNAIETAQATAHSERVVRFRAAKPTHGAPLMRLSKCPALAKKGIVPVR